MLRLRAEGDVVREVERLAPVDNLPIRVVAVLGTERRPADQTLEHDGTQRPPITVEGVALAREDLGRDVVGRTDGRVGHHTARFPPIIDLRPVADREVDLIDGDRISVSGPVRLALQELLVIVVIVQFVESGGETEISELDVASPVEQDIVGLDITSS